MVDIYYNGTVTFDKDVSGEKARLAEIFPSYNNKGLNASVVVCGCDVSFEDYNGGEGAVEDLVNSLKEEGINPVSGSVAYYGDYEGGCEVTPNGATDLGNDGYRIHTAADADLIKELRRRGYVVEKPAVAGEDFEATLYYGYYNSHDAYTAYHAFELSDPEIPSNDNEVMARLADALDAEPDDDDFNWDFEKINLPKSLIERIVAKYGNKN